MSRLPACSGSAGRRAAPRSRRPGGDDVREAGGARTRPVSSSRFTAASSAPAPVLSVRHTCGGARTIGGPPAGCVAAWARNTSAAAASWVASGGLVVAAPWSRTPWSRCRGSRVPMPPRRPRRAGEQGVGEHGEQRRRPDRDRHRTGRPRVRPSTRRRPAPRRGYRRRRHRRAPARRAHRPLGQVVASRTGVPRVSVTTARRVGDGQPAEVAPAARGPARRGRRRRRAGRRRSCRARPPRSASSQAPATSAPVPGTVPFGAAHRVALPHRGSGRDEVGIDGQAGGRADGRPGGRPLGERGEQPPEATVRGQRAGQVVVGEQGLLTGHRRQPVRRVDQRVEHGQAGAATRRRGHDRGVARARACRQRQHRQQQARGGQPGAQPVARHPVDVDEQLVHPGPVQCEAVSRVAAQRDGQRDRHRAARREGAGQRGERGGGGVGAAVTGQGVAHVAVGAQRLAALQPDLEVADHAVAGVAQRARDGDARRAVGGDHPRCQPAQLEGQRPGRGGTRAR